MTEKSAKNRTLKTTGMRHPASDHDAVRLSCYFLLI
jgi:hypothetical protein